MDERDGPPTRLVQEWALCAIAAAAARFVPVPLLDDAIRERATRVAVLRTLRSHGRRLPADAVEPLYAGVDSWGAGVLRAVVGVPAKIVLFPVRKYVAIFGAVKGVPTDVMEVLLLARSVHRALDHGRLTGDDPRALRREAVGLRRAYDAAVGGMDLRLFAGAVSDALSQGKPLTRAAVTYARRFVTRKPPADVDAALHPGGQVEQSAQRVEQVMARPEVARLIEEFDRRFDARLASDAVGGEGGRR